MPIPTAAAPATRTLLRDQVYARMVEAIVSGELAPGSTLVDKHLESWLGASRTPIREAISRLSGIGLVEIIPQKETRVSEIDLRRFAQIMETLGALNTAVVQETVPLLTTPDHDRLRSLRDALDLGEKRGPSPARTDAVWGLFDVFLDRYDNRVARRLPERYSPELRRVLVQYGDRIDVPSGFPPLRELIDAALAGDASAAAIACQRYFQDAMVPFAQQLADEIEGTPAS